MSQLPPGWVECDLGDITTDCEQRIPASVDRFTYIDIGSIDRQSKAIESAEEVSGANAPSRARKVVRSGDTLVSMTRPNLNAVALVNKSHDGQIASTGFDVLRPIQVDPRWIYYLVRSSDFVEAMCDLVQGALYPAVRSKDVRSFAAPLAPVAEQKRIADKLDRLLSRIDRCRERLDRVPAILNRFRQSVLAAAISGKLTEEWRERNGVSLESWSSKPFADLLSAIESGINVKCTERPPQPNEKGLVKISAVTWGAYNDDESKTLPAEMEIPASTRIRIGDFLISRANTLELVGACVIVDRVSRPVYLSDKVLRLVMPEDLKRWILYYLRSPDGRKQIESLASGNQLSMRNISQANLRSIMIKLPSTSEREEIIGKVKSLLDSADRLGRRYEAAHKSTEILTPTFLAKAFRGDLVPQNPDDEPASVLLERIREQRQISPPNKPKRPTKQTPRAPKKKAAMTKSRFDEDVQGKPYLAGFLKGSKKNLSAEDLFKKADLPLVDFYKQLDFEVKQKLIIDRDGQLEAA